MEGTKTIHAVFATATAASNGQSVGDISVILPEGLATSLKNNVENAANLCSAVRKRDDASSKQIPEEGKKSINPLSSFAETIDTDLVL